MLLQLALGSSPSTWHEPVEVTDHAGTQLRLVLLQATSELLFRTGASHSAHPNADYSQYSTILLSIVKARLMAACGAVFRGGISCRFKVATTYSVIVLIV